MTKKQVDPATLPDRVLRKGWVLAVLLLAPFMAQADATIANVATPSIHADLGASGAALELVIGGYLIAFAVLLITGARLGQTHGYKRLFLIGIASFSGASLLCGLAPSPVILVGARVLQGAGAALMFPQALTGIQLNFSGAERTRAIGLYAIALSSGAVIGQILGGALIAADLAGTQWRAIFLINVPIGVAGIVAAVRHLPTDTERVSRHIDLPGVALLSVSLLLVVLPLSLGHAEGWPAWTWVSLVASLPAFAAFIAAQRRVADRGGSPLVNVRILAARPVFWGLATLLAATGTYYALLFTLAQYLQQGLGHSALVSGLTLFSALISHLTTAVPTDYAPDISGVSTTTLQVGGALGVAALGTLYLSLTPTGARPATHAFAVTTAAFAAIAILATAMAHHATHPTSRTA